MAPPKRKRDRNSVDAGDSRPSPHRPANMNLGQHDMRDSGNRRSSRGDRGELNGRGGGNGRGGRNERSDANRTPITPHTPIAGHMSPPMRPPSAVQTPIQPSTPVAEVTPHLQKADPLPYDYLFLTDDRLKSWREVGRQEVIASGVQARQDEDTADLASIFQELIRATLDGKLGAVDAGSCVESILGLQQHVELESFDASTLLVDVLALVCETEPPPVNPVLQQFAASTGVPPILMRQSLDTQVLNALGLTRDTFTRMGIRYATQQLYKQANFNLLREESEGYAKLATELYMFSSETGDKIEVVNGAFERVKGLIGTFDLDVGRVLDIALDVLAGTLITRFKFFICFLRQSSWWPRTDAIPGVTLPELLPSWALPTSSSYTSSPEEVEAEADRKWQRDTIFWQKARDNGLDAFFELAGHQAVDGETRKRVLGDYDSDDVEWDADRQWIKVTKTLPPHGNRLAAQLLGFKLRYYDSEVVDKGDDFPPNLLYTTALLIKVGFISLRDIYPHLPLTDEEMEEHRVLKIADVSKKERANRPGAKANALMMASALPDDTLPSGSRPRDIKTDSKGKEVNDEEEEEKMRKKKLETPHKISLLRWLLTIGAIPEALFILGQYPWAPDVEPELIPAVNRILHHSLNHIYNTMCTPIGSTRTISATKLVADSNQSGLAKGTVRLTQLPQRRVQPWPFPDQNGPGSDGSIDFRFYWREWADDVPVCQNVDDVFTLASTLLNCAGVEVGRDISLLMKLARIGNASLIQDSSQANLARWQDLLKRIIAPALSFTRSNAAIVNEVYDMLRHYPTPVRYSIYAEWFEGQTSRLPAIQKEFSRTESDAMGILKRISKTNIPSMARSLAKVAYGSPGVVFRVALGQIEVYTNLTDVVVECAKYFTDLGYDVLVWSLMSSLGGNRKRSSHDSPLIPSAWLLALSRFTGRIFKRYSIINPSSILQYVNHQLYRNSSMDLQVLKELISQMAGIVPNTDFTNQELTAMTGRATLRRVTLIAAMDSRYSSEKTSKRLIKSLVDTRLVGELLVGIAQYRQSAIYSVDEGAAHIKFLATIVDDTQNILAQYLDLLRTALSVEDFDKQVPDIPELLTEFGMQPALAFMIGRVSVLSQIATATSPVVNGTPKASVVKQITRTELGGADVEGDVEMGLDVVQSSEQESTHGDVDITLTDIASPALKDQSPPITDLSEPVLDKFQQCLEPIVNAVKGLHSEEAWKHISPEFYATFWITTLSEITVPRSSYDAVTKKLDIELRTLESSRASNADKHQQRLALSDEKLVVEREKMQHLEYVQKLKARFGRRKSSWFYAAGKADELSDDFLEKCLLPRLLQSRIDADFCFNFIKYMHDTGTPNFRLLSVYGRLFKPHRLRTIIFTCTSREVEHLGRFLRAVLEDLAKWHSDKTKYQKEALGSVSNPHLIGFAKALDDDGKPKGFLDHVGERSFTDILFSWHRNIYSALRTCLEGTEWMHIRNAITILQSLSGVFPKIDFMGKAFISQLEEIAEREKDGRADLALAANSALAPVMKGEGSIPWVSVQFFKTGQPDPKSNGTSASVSRSSTTSKTILKPTAAEFRPRPSNATATSSPKTSANEAEEGEVDDAKRPNLGSNHPADRTDTPKLGDVSKSSTAAVSTTDPPKTSDVLLRREKILQEKAAAAAKQKAQAKLPSRPENSRQSSNTPSGREIGSLPPRPEASFPLRSDLERSRQGDRRDGRDMRHIDDNRSGRPSERPSDRASDRPIDKSSERPRELVGNDRRHADSISRDPGRPNDRSAPSDRIRPDPPPRWTADSPREHQERVTLQSRTQDSGRLSRDVPGSTSRSDGYDRSGAATPDRGANVNQQRQELINPARAHLISKTDANRDGSPHRHRDEVRDRNSSRNHSPRRNGADKDSSTSRRDDRAGRSNVDDAYQSNRGRPEDHHHPPAGPRSDRTSERSSERASERGTADRSTLQAQSQSQSRAPDPDHGRLNAPSRGQADPNFGRLNPAPAPADIPSGPRDPSSRGNRPPPNSNMDQTPKRDVVRGQSPTQQPPSGPAAGRQSRRTGSGQFTNITVNTPLTSIPANSSPITAVHPSRLGQLPVQAQAVPLSRSEPTSVAIGGGMHPDRARKYGVDMPTNQQGNNQNRQVVPSQQSPVSAGPPLGPKVTQANPLNNMNHNTGISAPTGPASANDRSQRGGRRQLAGINTMLQQSNSPGGIHVRGRGRTNAGGFGDNTNQIPSPSPVQPVSQPPPHSEFSNNSLRDLINPARADLIANTGTTNNDRDRDRSSRREHEVHSRRSSRSPGRDRDQSKKHTGNDDRSANDHRDRRGGERHDDRDRHANRAEAQHDLITRDQRNSNSRDGSIRPQDYSGRPDRDPVRARDGRDVRDNQNQGQAQLESYGYPLGDRGDIRNGRSERGEQAPERGGRSREVRNDHRNDERRASRGGRGGADDGRKRHSEGGEDLRGRDKRPRRT